jgi:hypothetical protein
VSTAGLSATGTGSFGNISTTGNLAVGGAVNINSYPLPLFNNGIFSGSTKAVIPVLWVNNSYNLVEIKVTFICSVVCDVSISGNTASNGTGTTLPPQEHGETTVKSTVQGTPVYTNTGVVATQCAALSINNHFKLSMSKGDAATGYSNRNYYCGDTVYVYNAIGTARVYAMGHFDSTTLASVVLTCSTGTISGTYNTVYSY